MTNQESRHQITVAEMAPHVHSFSYGENKADKILKWLINWIDFALECRKVSPYDFMPSKSDLAFHIGVSKGTIQNVFRQAEDLGYLESKQKVGTYIKDRTNSSHEINKLTSRRELAIEIIKKFITEEGYKKGEIFISTRKLAEITGISNTTIRLAMVNLVSEGVLKKDGRNFIVFNPNCEANTVQTKTLVEKTAEKIKKYIKNNLKSGDKIPTNTKLAKMFDVSVKTVHDAIKDLSKEGILYTRRGRYGTTVSNSEKESEVNLYNYEKIEQKIKQYIRENCQIEQKLPSIKEFAETFNTSEKTVKNALNILFEEGYITFVRGRYGGTFVIDIPQGTNEAYKWLAISNDYMQSN